MAYGKYIEAYQQSAVSTASPAQMIVMLYDGAISFMEQGKSAMAEKDYEKQNIFLQRAQKIVIELMQSLNVTIGGDVAKNLLSLYEYSLNELVQANIHDKPEKIDHALDVFTKLRMSWATIAQNERSQVSAAAA